MSEKLHLDQAQWQIGCVPLRPSSSKGVHSRHDRAGATALADVGVDDAGRVGGRQLVKVKAFRQAIITQPSRSDFRWKRLETPMSVRSPQHTTPRSERKPFGSYRDTPAAVALEGAVADVDESHPVAVEPVLVGVAKFDAPEPHVGHLSEEQHERRVRRRPT